MHAKIFASTEQEQEFGMRHRQEVINAKGLTQTLKKVSYRIPEKEIQDRIKVYLGIRISDSLPRCQCKSCKRAKYLARQGHPEHLDSTHICEECRCQKVAGWGTLGDYGFGYNVGHYGRGLCGAHELAAGWAPHAEAVTRVHTEVLRQGKDFAYASSGNQWLDRVKKESDLATDRITLHAEIDIMRATMQELHDRCLAGMETPPGIEEAIKDLQGIAKNLSASVGDIETEIIKDKIDRLTDMLYQTYSLTESTKNGPGPMSTETRMTLAAKFADVIGKLNLHQSKMSMDQYIHVDYIKLWAKDIYQATKEILHPVPADEQLWLNRISKIPEPMRGRKT